MRSSLAQRGFSILEMLASLGTASVVAAALCAMLGTSGLVLRETTGLLSDLSVSAAAENAIRAGSRAVGRSRLPFTITIAPSSTTLLANGSPHPLAALSGSSAPAASSHIVSFIELSPHYAGVIQRTMLLGSSVTVVACGFQSRPSPSQFKSYIALGASGAVQIAGILRTISTSCIELTGSPIAGLVSNPANVLPSSLHRLIPVNREHSLFVDRSGQLRLSSHTGTTVSENQPLGSGAKKILIAELRSTAGPVALSVSVTGAHDTQSNFVVPLRLLPGSYYDHIF